MQQSLSPGGRQLHRLELLPLFHAPAACAFEVLERLQVHGTGWVWRVAAVDEYENALDVTIVNVRTRTTHRVTFVLYIDARPRLIPPGAHRQLYSGLCVSLYVVHFIQLVRLFRPISLPP
jgi:hypothetical protein